MAITRLAAIATATVAATVAFPATAHAEGEFQSPTGNIHCMMIPHDNRDNRDNGAARVVCEIADTSYERPPKPSECHLGGWGNRITLDQGSMPTWTCHGDSMSGTEFPTLQYGQTRSAGTITCDDEPTGMKCTDSSTGHYFRLSRESYEVA